MKSERSKPLVVTAIFIAIGVLFIQSCTKAPTPAFTYEPTVNPEAGDSIFFINTSLDATSYDWDFGDGSTSSDIDPTNIYVEAGSYDVTLTAINEKTSVPIIQTITINEPTVLAAFVYEDDEVTVVPDVSVWVYDNEYDWQNWNDPQFESYTDNDGFAMFLNLEAQEYIIDLYKDTETGYWGIAYTVELTQNDINLYGLPMEFIPDSTKKGMVRKIDDRTQLLPARRIEK